MKLLSQIGSHAHVAPARTSRLWRVVRRVRWSFVAWLAMAVTTATIAIYAVRVMARIMAHAAAM